MVSEVNPPSDWRCCSRNYTLDYGILSVPSLAVLYPAPSVIPCHTVWYRHGARNPYCTEGAAKPGLATNLISDGLAGPVSRTWWVSMNMDRT